MPIGGKESRGMEGESKGGTNEGRDEGFGREVQ